MMNLQMQLATLRQAWFWKRLCLYMLCYTPVCYAFSLLRKTNYLSPRESSVPLYVIGAFSVIAFTMWVNRDAMKRTNPDQAIRNQ